MTALAWYGAAFATGLLAGGAAVLGLRSRFGSTEDTGSATLLDGFDYPVFLLDRDGVVQYANPACADLFGTADSPGMHVREVLADFPAVCEVVTDRRTDTVEAETDGDIRYLDVCVRTSPEGGRLVSIRDVTEQRSQLRTQSEELADLEAENERLDQFASVISHDLRNPLDVAKGRTNAVKEMLDDPELEGHLGGVQDAHDRMQEIISDVLTLARNGQNIGETAFVPLETAAADAWSHVDTADATLTVETQLVVDADPDRLHQLLENLFRNAIQHAGEDVSVQVTELPGGDGFAVSDDGPGIPPEDRDRLLKTGETGDSGGTGLGLAIVSTIADAHGWSFTVTSSESGGARFEFSGVQIATEEFAPAAVD